MIESAFSGSNHYDENKVFKLSEELIRAQKFDNRGINKSWELLKSTRESAFRESDAHKETKSLKSLNVLKMTKTFDDNRINGIWELLKLTREYTGDSTHPLASQFLLDLRRNFGNKILFYSTYSP
jgi:hypothetical protein